jgi:hypothetical protein
VGYYNVPPDRSRAVSFEQQAPITAQFDPNYSSLTMNISLDMARRNTFHPQLSTVAQLLKPDEGAMIRREIVKNGQC